MNNTEMQAPAAANNMMDPGVTILLIVIALFAALTVAGILYGMHLKRRRAAADEEFEEHRAAAGQEPAIPPESGVGAPSPLAPVAPPPPALDATLDGAPAAATSPAAEAPSDIMLIKGLGPRLATRLAELGVTRLDQIAALTPDAAEKLDVQLGAFAGRLTRDRWVDQAKLLAAGNKAAFEAEFGKL